MTTKVAAEASNQAFWGLVDKGMTKEAANMVGDFTRVRIRESSVFEKGLPSEKIGEDDLTPQLGTDKPVKLVNREPNSPAAITIPIGAQPIQYYFRGDKYPVFFDRIVTARFQKDTAELKSYGIDIRQILTDNALLDAEAELDRKWFIAVDSIVGTQGSSVAETGVVQNKKIIDAGGFTRSSMAEVFKVLPNTFAKLPVVTAIINHISVWDIAKLDRTAAGGDLSQSFFQNGFQEKKLYGVNWVVTNKSELVPDGVIYTLADPTFVGKSYILEDITMFVEQRGYQIEWFAYSLRGGTIGNPASVARVQIATS